MIVPENPEDIEERIRGCENNLKSLEKLDCSNLEKLQLREIYRQQIRKYKQKRLSFLNVPNQ